jgi:hypothetical protein
MIGKRKQWLTSASETSRAMRMNVEQMQAHILALCEANEIACRVMKGAKGWGSYFFREIEVPPIRSARSYATALHEIRHILGRHQVSNVILVRERWAWQWARRNALEWTPAMERHARWCLEYYERTPYARRSNVCQLDPRRLSLSRNTRNARETHK